MDLQWLARSSAARIHPNPFKISSSRVLTPPNATPSRVCVVILTLELLLTKQHKSKTSSEDMGHSLCVFHTAFHAEGLLMYAKEAQSEGRLSLRIGEEHNCVLSVLGNAGRIVAYVVTSEGQHGLVDVS